MEIGLHLSPTPADEWFIRDLGVTWFKWGAQVGEAEVVDQRRQHDEAARLGCRTVVDLRTTTEYLTQLGHESFREMAAHQQLQEAPEGSDPDTQEAVIKANQRQVNAEVMRVVCAQVQRHVALHRDHCRDWEWWGESACPITSAGIFHVLCYPETLRAVNAAIHEVQPEARVWTGGNGMDLHDGWVQGLQGDGALKSFDVLNWHPYPMALRDRGRIEQRLHENYRGWREILDTVGNGQPFASTEWGYPSLRYATKAQREWLTSRVVAAGISQLMPEEALDAYEGDLRIMTEYGFQVVIVHSLRDGPTRFWGDRCGLLEAPTPGVRGRLARAWRKTAEAKPVYRVVQRWAHRGASGTKAFEEKLCPSLQP